MFSYFTFCLIDNLYSIGRYHYPFNSDPIHIYIWFSSIYFLPFFQMAERANGILKVEWLYKMQLATRKECEIALVRIIDFYNTQRPHMSIGMQTPEVAHRQHGEQRRCWKNSYAMG